MSKDKWFALINDEMEDIPARIEKIKSWYWKRAIPFALLTAFGGTTMGVFHNSGAASIGCFMAVSGVVGFMAIATMCHSQLCMYRTVIEIRKIMNETAKKD